MSQNLAPRARPGFGPKPLFFDVLRAHFETHRRARRLATALLGAACEQWINTEAYIALNHAGRRLAVIPEREKRDLILYVPGELGMPCLIVETKLIYVAYPPSTKAAKIGELRAQLEDARATHPSARVVGLLIDVAWRRGRAVSKWARPGFTSADELDVAGLKNDFASNGYRVPLPPFVRVNGSDYEVACRFELVRLRDDP